MPAEREQERPEERDELVRVGRVRRRLLAARSSTCASGGRIASICATSCASVTSGFAATAISSSCPDLLEEPLRGREVEAGERRAADREPRAELDDPRDAQVLRPGPRPARRSSRRPRSPPSRRSPCRPRPRSAPATSPSTSVSGLKTESPFAIEKPRFGAPPKTTALPSSPMSCVASESTLPSACGDVGQLAHLRQQRLVERRRGDAAACPQRSKADLPVMTAFEPLRMSVKIRSNAWSIESVRTYVPLIIATPRTIAIAVSAVRSLRLRSPRIGERGSSRRGYS